MKVRDCPAMAPENLLSKIPPERFLDLGAVARVRLGGLGFPSQGVLVSDYVALCPGLDPELLEALVLAGHRVGDRLHRLHEVLAHPRGGVAQGAQQPSGGVHAVGTQLDEGVRHLIQLVGRFDGEVRDPPHGGLGLGARPLDCDEHGFEALELRGGVHECAPEQLDAATGQSAGHQARAAQGPRGRPCGPADFAGPLHDSLPAPKPALLVLQLACGPLGPVGQSPLCGGEVACRNPRSSQLAP